MKGHQAVRFLASNLMLMMTHSRHILEHNINIKPFTINIQWGLTKKMTHRAAIFSDAVCEAAVAFCSDLNLIGALQKQSLLKVACGLIHVGNAVLAVICDVLGGLSGHKAQEGKLDVDILRLGVFTAILELKKREKRQIFF